jgi:hypothetical protein
MQSSERGLSLSPMLVPYTYSNFPIFAHKWESSTIRLSSLANFQARRPHPPTVMPASVIGLWLGFPGGIFGVDWRP